MTIPFFQYNQIIAGPLTIQVWGLLASLGIIIAVSLAYYLAQRYFLSQEVVIDFGFWMIIAGFIGARLFHVVFYDPAYYLLYPWDVFKFWQGGASSLGGFFGAAFAAWLLAKKRNFTFQELSPYFDILAVSLWLGWGIGRIGCFLIHDHPGKLTNFFLAVQYPGGARHDLGLYESFLGLALFAICYLLFRRLIKIRWGLAALFSTMLYAIARFFLDFLRATDLPQSDIRYFYLTPAQWGMIVIIFSLTLLMISAKVKRKIANKI